MESITEVLQQSLMNGKLSKNDQKKLENFFEEADIAAFNEFRRQAFSIARAALTDPKSKKSLEWLEKIIDFAPKSHNENPSLATVHFSPGMDCLNSILGLLRVVTNTLDICVYTITDDRIMQEVIRAYKQRNVKVRIITDNDKAEDIGSDISSLRESGIPIVMDDSPNHMHHKFAIFDKKVIVTGSYNWTRSASLYNQENTLVSNDTRIVKAFVSEFEKLWKDLSVKEKK